jgi:hypothetical protein
MSEVPKPTNINTLTSPPPLHHNKICLIDLAISLHQRTSTNSNLEISLSSLLGLLMDPDRHVRSRMVEAVQLIGSNNSQSQSQTLPQQLIPPQSNLQQIPQLSLSQIETELFEVTNKLMSSGEGDFILTAIELIGILRGIPAEAIRKFLDLVMGVVVPVFGKVVSIPPGDISKTVPVKVSLPQNTLLQR